MISSVNEFYGLWTLKQKVKFVAYLPNAIPCQRKQNRYKSVIFIIEEYNFQYTVLFS